MNTEYANMRKKEIRDSLKAGKNFFSLSCPAEVLALINHKDPIDFECGLHHVMLDMDAEHSHFYDFCSDEQIDAHFLEVARNSFMMDSTRATLNKYKYENGLIPDDELLILAYFLMVDSYLIRDIEEFGEVDSDDMANMLNLIASRLKFLFLCIRSKRFDIINTMFEFVKRKKIDAFNTFHVFPDVEADDGGVIEFFRAMTDSEAYNIYRQKEQEAYEAKLREEAIFSGIQTGFDGDDGDEDDDSDNYSDDKDPLVERDFEG